MRADACRICGLLFNRDPIDIGRSTIDPTICIICEEHNMETNTRTKIIKVHTLVIDDTEIEAFLTDPDPLIDALRDLLVAKAPPNGNGHAPSPVGEGRGEGKPRKKKLLAKSAVVNCKYCARLISTRQIGRHENKCPKRTEQLELPAID